MRKWLIVSPFIVIFIFLWDYYGELGLFAPGGFFGPDGFIDYWILQPVGISKPTTPPPVPHW